MKSIWKLIVFSLLVSCLGFAQAQRYDGRTITRSGPYLVVDPFSSVVVCGSPAVFVPGSFCTNVVPTYTSNTLSTACTGGQVTPATGGACTSASDVDANFGFWAPFGNYTYMFQIKGVVYGPFPVFFGLPVTGGTLTGALYLASDPIVDAQAATKHYVDNATTSGVPSGRTVSTTAPLAGGGALSSNLTLTCNVASASQPGCLAAADFATFNGKQAPLGFTPLNRANNLSDLASVPTARTNLGLGSAALLASTAFVADPGSNGIVVRTGLGTSTVATGGTLTTLLGYTPLNAASNLSDVASVSASRTNLGLGTAATHAATDFLLAASNLSDVADVATARTNLGLGSAALANATSFLLATNNLSDIVSPSAARTNLGLGTSSTHATGDFLLAANNLSDVNAAIARANLGLGTAALQSAASFLLSANNLSDVGSASAARTNLGIGTSATHATGDFLQSANNLSDVASVSGARANLGLGTAALVNTSGIGGNAMLQNAPVLGSYLVSSLPGSAGVNAIAWALDSMTAQDCIHGGGTLIQLCRYTGTVWVPAAQGYGYVNVGSDGQFPTYIGNGITIGPSTAVGCLQNDSSNVTTGTGQPCGGGSTGGGSNALLSGGGVAWTGGLNFIVSSASYSIAGTNYSSAQTSISLATADPTNPRIDVIAVNASGAVVVLTGTPASNPSAPAVDPTTQLQLTFAFVPAGSPTPTLTSINVYLENTEWTCVPTANLNCASTNNPFQGAKDIEATNAVAGNNVTLTQPVGTTNLSQYATLSFYIRNKAAWATAKSVSIFFQNGTSVVGTAVAFKNGIYGFNQSNTTTYQLIVIPLTAFAAGSNPVNNLKIQVAGSGAAIGFYLDNIEIQSNTGGGGSGASGNVFAAGILGVNQLVLGAGAQNLTTLPTLGASNLTLHGNASGPPTWGLTDLTTDVTGILPKANGGTGTATPGLIQGANILITGSWPNQTISSSGISIGSLSGGATGSLPYQSAPNTTAMLAGNNGNTDQVLVSHGTGSAPLAPTLTNAPALSAANMLSFPTLNQDTTGKAAGISGTQSANVFYASPNGSTGLLSPRLIVPADIPTLNQSTTGNAATASAFDHSPTLCPGGSAAAGVLANGNATGCQAIGGGFISGLTIGKIPKAASSTSLADSLLDDSITTANTLTYLGSGGFATSGPGFFGVGAAGAGFIGLKQGTTQATSANTWGLTVGTSITTGFNWIGPSAAASGIVRGDNTANKVQLSQAELSGDASTSGSNAVTVTGLKGLALPTLAAVTGLLYDTSGTLSLQATLPTAAEPAHTGDVTNTAGSLALTVAKIQGTTVSGTTGTGNVAFSASPSLTGTPLAPTASLGTNTTQLATTAFVQAAFSGSRFYTPIITIGSTIATSQTVFAGTVTNTPSGATVTIPANCSNSQFVDIGSTTATGSTTFVVKKNGSTICTGTIAAAGSTISWGSGGSTNTFTSGDVISVVYSGDATLLGALTLAGSY